MVRLGIFIILLCSLVGCGDPCEKGMVRVYYTLVGGAENADNLGIAYAGQSKYWQPDAAHSFIDIALVPYPEGKQLTFTLTAIRGLNVLAIETETVTAAPTCTALSFVLDASKEDLSVVDLEPRDLAAPDATAAPLDMGPVDLQFIAGPSCNGLPETCGADGGDTCCDSPLVTGGTFYRSYDTAADELFVDNSNPATVSDFRLDRYEVTVGRFRAYLNNAVSAAVRDAFMASLKCDPAYQTWTDTPGTSSTENLPINCVNRDDAAAFCNWDGGGLPTEAQWNYAASGGDEQRAFPWSTPPSDSTTPTCAQSNYDACVDGANQVGSESPAGDGKWGHSDLAGNVKEWILDISGTYPNPCVDCVRLTPQSPFPFGSIRGGSFGSNSVAVRNGTRDATRASELEAQIGIRCAR